MRALLVENAELRQKIEDKLLEHLGMTRVEDAPAAEPEQ